MGTVVFSLIEDTSYWRSCSLEATSVQALPSLLSSSLSPTHAFAQYFLQLFFLFWVKNCGGFNAGVEVVRRRRLCARRGKSVGYVCELIPEGGLGPLGRGSYEESRSGSFSSAWGPGVRTRVGELWFYKDKDFGTPTGSVIVN